MNGLSGQPSPSAANPISYPFKSFDGRVTFARERWGQRVFDMNKDGVAQYGNYADWLEAVRVVGGRPVMKDLFTGAEAYLQMWERANGVRATFCRGAARTLHVPRPGLRPPRRHRRAAAAAGRSADQPTPFAYRYCVGGAANRRAVVVAVFTRGRVGLVATTARGHRAGGVGPGARATRLRRATAVRARDPGPAGRPGRHAHRLRRAARAGQLRRGRLPLGGRQPEPAPAPAAARRLALSRGVSS